MTWLNTVTRSVANGVQGLASGVWAAVATPFVYTPLRPVTKQAIKGGLWVARGARSVVEVTQQEWHTLVAEAEAEAHAGEASPPSGARSAAGGDGQAGPPRTRASATDADAATEADNLTAIKGIGDDYARLLRAGGISSVEQLARQEPESLRPLLLDANEAHEVVGRVPSTGRLRGWIERAGTHTE